MFSNQNIPPLNQMPCVFRIVSITAKPGANGRRTDYRAELYHDKVSLTVSFSRSQPDIRLKKDMLVSVRWSFSAKCEGGALQIIRLVLLERPIASLNIFETVPPDWIKDRGLVKRAKEILDVLPDNLRFLFIAILWNGTRFRKFCNRPSSISGHHSYENGNLVHTVEVAETVLLNACRYPQANLGISLTAALLHDIGKADEYNPWSNGWGMTDRGKLVGHRHTVIEWIAAAMALNQIVIPESHFLSLLHALTAAPGAEYIGIRPPTTPEATLLNVADKLSGESSLTSMLANQKGGWGNQHRHKKSKPYTLPSDAASASF